MLSHLLTITPCSMAISLTPVVKSMLIGLLAGGGFSLQVAALECLNKCMQISELDGTTTVQLAQTVASIITRWQSQGPKESPLLSAWQAQLLSCLQILLSKPTGKACERAISQASLKALKLRPRCQEVLFRVHSHRGLGRSDQLQLVIAFHKIDLSNILMLLSRLGLAQQ